VLVCVCAVIGAAVLVVAYIRVATWLQTAYRQTFRIRVALLQAVLRQEIGWFDTHDAGELGSRLSESVLAVLFVCFRQSRISGLAASESRDFGITIVRKKYVLF